MRARILMGLISIAVFGGCQAHNSSSGDGSSSFDPNDPFSVAKSVMSNSCTPCHQFHTESQASLITQGYVVAGDPDNSTIYNALRNSTAPTGDKDMPPGQPLSDSDIEKIRSWIQGISP